MVTDEQIRALAYAIWEEEGRPDGNDIEHYLKAKKLLEERETKRVFESKSQPPIAKSAPTEGYSLDSGKTEYSGSTQEEIDDDQFV